MTITIIRWPAVERDHGLVSITIAITITITITIHQEEDGCDNSCDLKLDTWDTDYIADNWEQHY